MNALIELITACINYNENNAIDMRRYLMEPGQFESLWRLYFDPLLIETVDSLDERARTNAVGQPAYLCKQSLTVRWTDGREDVCSDGVVQPRERVDNLVHQALAACENREQLMNLLSSMQTSLTRAVHLLPAWLRLYTHLMTSPYFDVTVSQCLFDRLHEVSMDNCGAALTQFILAVFDSWPSLSNVDLHTSVRQRLMELIRILVNHKTHESNTLTEQLTERICAYTPAHNVRGHLCFFLLLSDLMPSYYEAGLSNAIKKIDKNTLLWYIDYILDNETADSDENRTALLLILKYVSMYTEHDFLCEWFDRIVTHPGNLLCFRVLEHSLYPTTTLATYVQHANEMRVQQLLDCIQSKEATQFITILSTIIECLIKNAQTQKYLFGTDHLFRVIQSWLLMETSPSTQFHLVQLLLDIGYSKYSHHAHEIAQFFLGQYSSTLIATDFEGRSPLAHIVLFILSNVELDQTIDERLSLQPETLIQSLFRSIDETIDDENNSGSSHLLSLSAEIVHQRSHDRLVSLLSPSVPDIMGLLGRTGQLKKSGIILLAEILNLSSSERSVLIDNVQDPSTVDDAGELSNTNIQQQAAFFSSEVSNATEVAPVRHDDFVAEHKFLTSLKDADSDKVDQILRSHLSQQRLDVSPPGNPAPQQDRLVLTATARENVSKILEVLEDPIPILLEGSTGVGKSASVMEAAHQAGRTLVRYNMSSRVTIDDLLGKVSLVPDVETETTRLQFLDGPFTTAFARGYWILFDELNLAQDTVLQAIESALDTRQLTVSNSSSAEQPVLVYRMHSDFRLFATQNPNTGFFKGKREKLSPSFLSRFRPLVFKELPDKEWREIVQQQLAVYLPDEAEALAELLVSNFNSNIRKVVSDTKQTAVEVGPYAETSIRELLKWVRLLTAQKCTGLWPQEVTQRATLLSFSAWCVYGARYRAEGRAMVESILTDDGKGGWGRPPLRNIKMTIDPDKNYMDFDTVRYHARVETSVGGPQSEWFAAFTAANLGSVEYDPNLWKPALEVHTAIHKTLLNMEFIRLHGIYRIDRSWLWEWLVSAARINVLTAPKQLAQCGSQMYQNRFRHSQAQEMVRHLFSRIFNDPALKEKIPDGSFVRPEMPYVLTDRVLATLKQVCFNMSIKQPVLVTGAEGCGKSELLLTLAWFSGQRVHQLNITPETEPSALIGQLVPNDSKDESDPNNRQKLIWQHGCVTQAYTTGQWVLLDNLSIAESSVLERLNPVLEQKPMLILTERGDVDEQLVHDAYQLVATMTPPAHRSQSQSSSADSASELSPALYNRFAVIHMPDISFDAAQNAEELLQIVKGLLSDGAGVDHALAVEFCRTILDFYTKHTRSFPKFTMRNIVRLLDSTYLLQLRFKSTLNFISSLWTAYHVTIANQIKEEKLKGEMNQHVKSLLTKNQPSITLTQPTFTDWIHKSNEHILTESRLDYANSVLGAVACNIPLLLEGPAAVGKTALISYLCKNLKADVFHRTAHSSIQLERVNNTDTTTIQDYLGTFLPVNDGFVFQKGALYRAMENGWWFLADEFNLADPAVMNVLFPLLEGKNAITIPSSGKVITAKPGFQFFATQNDASYANRYRLPVSLRNRFLEVQFGEFPSSELPIIILDRNEPGKLKPKCLTKASAEQLAQFYHRVLRTRSRITFRELVKWLHRHAFLSPDKELWSTIGASLLSAKYPLRSEAKEVLLEDLKVTWPRIVMSPNPQVEIKDIGGKVRYREGELYVDTPNMTLADSLVLSSPETFLRSLVRLALAVTAKEPVLLVGPTSCKTLLIETWASLSNRSSELIKVHLTPDTEAGDLIGEIQPYSMLDLLKRLPAMAERVYLRFQSLCRHHSNTGLLTMKDETFLQPLVDAIKIQLPDAIRQFEQAYSREEERGQQKDELYDNFPALRAQAEALQIPSADEARIQNTDDDDTRGMNSTVLMPQTMPSTMNPLSSLYTWEDDYDASYRPENGEIYGNETYSTEDDGFEVYSNRSSMPTTMEYPTSSIDVTDDGFGSAMFPSQSDAASPSSNTVFDDGFPVPTTVQEPAAEASYQEDSADAPTETMLEDGFSNVRSMSKPMNSHAPPIPASNPTERTEFSEMLTLTVVGIREIFRSMLQHTNYAPFTTKDVTLLDYQTKFNDVWERLAASNCDRSKPIFLFNDGPVTVAAKRGGILFLEDLDLPSQAVIERLNSMLEPSPTFALTEDITSHAEKGQLDIFLSNQFQVFASVHQEQAHQLLKLSPATRSRFTEIYVPTYTETELRLLIRTELSKHNISANQIDTLVEVMFSLRQKLHEEAEWKLENDIQLLFRWSDFIVKHHASVSLIHRMFLGARFFFFDQLTMQRHTHLFDDWNKNSKLPTNYEQYRHIFQPPDAKHGAITFESIQSVDPNASKPLPFDITPDYISLKYTDVRYSFDKIDEHGATTPTNELRQRFYCVPTSTLINQIARIFAATSSKTPLLLEGPPGIGKTQVVTQVCALLGKECERINMSANTSLDQLIGCVIPRFVNGARIFQWQEGRVLAAIKARKWILFDELNLAAPEVLEGLTPLFYRGTSHFTVPSTGEMVTLGNVRLFATMNPSTIGGGRTKLPRSISNLFTIVQLDDYSENELRIILNSLFQQELTKESISMSQLDALFDLHTSLKELVRQGTIGRTGGPYELNLRDLSKFRDVFRGSIESQLFHYQYMNTTDDDDDDDASSEQQKRANVTTALSPSVGASDSRFLSIRKFAQVAYACQFHGREDFVKACEVINAKFPINNALSKRENESSIDTTVATVVRIGSIYINTGNEEPVSSNVALVHTEKTVRQLELLAAACQSKRAILLEGDICSRKSSLVIELARLTRQRLIIIPMHENFETSDLIGSWRPTASDKQNHPLFDKIETMCKQIIKMMFLIIMPLQSKASNHEVFSKFKKILRNRQPIPGSNPYEMIPFEIEALNELVTLLNKLLEIAQLGNDAKVLISCYARQADYYSSKLKSVRVDIKQEMSFTFVEAEFVQAIREGWWVLLDNINSAPPEVLERLNSLTEDNPMLSLYENSHGQILTQNDGIHANFRLFTTANLNRIYSNKLSSAFLNRVIRVWLPPIDDCQPTADADLTSSDLYELLATQLATIPAGKQLAHLLVLIHVNVKQYVKDGHLNYPSDFIITYRLLEQCVQTLCYLVNRNINPVSACYWALLRSYCSSLRDAAEYRFFITHLQRTIDRLKLRAAATIYSTPTSRVDRKQPLHFQEAQRIRSHFVQFERFLVEFQLTLLQILAVDSRSWKPTRDLLILFTDDILLPLTPSDAHLIKLKQILVNNDDEAKLDLPQILFELIQEKQIATRFDRTSPQDLSTFLQDFLSNGSKSFQALCDQLSSSLDTFIRNTSFSDTAERLAFLQRAVSITDTFHRLFSSSIFANFDQRASLTTLCSQVNQHLRPLLTLKEKHKSYELFHNAAFIQAKDQFRFHLFNHFDTGLIWSFERAQTFPIRLARKDLRKLIQHVVKDQTDRNLVLPLEYFATLQEWIGLQWTFDDYLSATVRDALQKNISITPDFILECELKFASWELCKQLAVLIDEIVRDLPSESSTANKDYFEMKAVVENIQNQVKQHEESIQQIEIQIEIKRATTATADTPSEQRRRGQLQRNHSVFNAEHDDLTVRLSSLKNEVTQFQSQFANANRQYMKVEQTRSAILEKALTACTKLQNETQKLLASAAYKFVRQRFEQPDAQQLTYLYQLLKEARQNPTLTNVDGLLDLRAMLATSFGRAFIEHDDVLQSPLIYLVCNFFVAPHLYQQRRLHFLTDWKQFAADLDIRTFNRSDLFFYCPTKQALDCCLLTVDNGPRQVSITTWSLQQYIDTSSLIEILNENLPAGVEHNIEYKELSDVARTLTNDNYRTFGFACLVHLYEQSGLSTHTTSEFHSQLLSIADQLKQFVQHKASERKALTVLIYQQLNRFEAELQALSLKNYASDPWMVVVEQMWTLIKPYQNIFSSITTQNIQQELKYTIQSVQPADLSSRITSLAYLQSLTDKYNCTHMIIDHLRDDGNLTRAENIKEFETFFEFISRMSLLLKLITQHVLFCGSQASDQFYQRTPEMISHLEAVFRSTLSVTEIVDGQLKITVKHSPATLSDFQKRLDQFLTDLRFPNALLSRYNLVNIITHAASLFDENRAHLSNSAESTDATERPSLSLSSMDPREVRRKTRRSRIETSIITITDLLSRASQLSIRPHHIIQRIHTTLHRLKTFDIGQESESNYNTLLGEEQTLADLLNKFTREINQYTSVNIALPNDQLIHQITDRELQMDHQATDLSNHQKDVEAFSTHFQQSSQAKQSTELNQIIRLTHAQVSDQTWIQAMSLLTSNRQSELKTILMTLNDDLAMQVERQSSLPENTAEHDLLTSNIVSTYAQFRCDLLNEETKRDMLSSYSTVACLSRELREWTTKTDLNVFNMLETIQKFKNDLSLAQNQMKNFTDQASCNLLPVDIRPEDLICLFAPEQTPTIQTIFAKFQEVDAFLACRSEKIEAMQLPTLTATSSANHGLASYVYHRDKATVALFDKPKHILPVVAATSKFIQQLIDVCIAPKTCKGKLMNTCTSVKELFPVQIALSTGLLVLIDSIGNNLKDFKQARLLAMTTLKIDQDSIKEMQLRRQNLEQDLHRSQKDAKEVAENLTDAQIELESVMQESYAYALMENKKNIVLDLAKRDNDMKRTVQGKIKAVDDVNKQLQELKGIYEVKLEQEQEEWLAEILKYFDAISQKIRTFVSSWSQQSSPTLEDLLTGIADVAQRQLLEPTTAVLDQSRIVTLQKDINELLAEIHNHLMKLARSDPMHSFVLFYCHITRMSFSSLLNSLASWSDYANILKTSQMKFYAEKTKKKDLASLNRWTSEQCQLFLREIRTGQEQTDIVARAQAIKKYVHKEVTSFDISFTGQDAKQMQHLIREFERFVINLLIVGCRFLQLQRGVNESLDELLTNVSIENLDLNLSRSELDLLKLLEVREMQLRSQSSTLLFLTLHLVFDFNSNPFGLFDQLEQSIEALTRLLVPAAYMIKRTWLTVDELIEKVAKQITVSEYDIVQKLSDSFRQFTDLSNQITNHSHFLSKQFESHLLQAISEHIDQLCDVFLRNRPGLKTFCEHLILRWHTTLKEVFRGFIQTQKHSIHRQLEWNQRKTKEFSDLLANNPNPERQIALADIEKVLKRKNIVLATASLQTKTTLLKRFHHLEIIYQLVLGGIDNLEVILMNKPIEQMSYSLINKLFVSTKNLYVTSEEMLLKQSFQDFLHDEASVGRSYQLIEEIYRQEWRIFQSFYQLSKEQIIDNYQQLTHASDFQPILEQSKQADQRWQTAGQHFVALRRKERQSGRNFFQKLGHGIANAGRNIQSAFISQSGSSEADDAVAVTLDNILLYMQLHQAGHEEIFTIPPQDEFEKLLRIHAHYSVSLKLKKLSESAFAESDKIYRFEITRFSPNLTGITILFWKDAEKAPFVTLPLPLAAPYTKYRLVVNASVGSLAIGTDFSVGKSVSWSSFTQKKKSYVLKHQLELKCERIHGKHCYIANGVQDTLSPSAVPSLSQIQNHLQILEEQLQSQLTHEREEDLFRTSSTTVAFARLTTAIGEIEQMTRCSELAPHDLSDASAICKAFGKMPQSDVYNRVANLLRSKTFPAMLPQIQFVDDNDPAIRVNFDQVWTHAMNDAFQSSRLCLINTVKQINLFHNQLRLTKAHLILAYAWANFLSLDPSSNRQLEFASMVNDYQQIPKLPKEDNIQHENDCQRIINDAQRIYRTIKRTSNNWTDVKRLLTLTSFPIEENLTQAFSHSQMSRDAHLWLTETTDETDASTTLQCHPQPAVLDFGITLSTIQQRLSQRIFFHNQTDRDLNIRIDRPSNAHKLFDVSGETIQLVSGATYELEVLLKSPTSVGSIIENWSLKIDDGSTLTDALRLQVQTVQVDVELSSETIDFGLIPCNSHRMERSIHLRNVLPCPVRIKAQLQSTETNRWQSNLAISNNNLEVAARSSVPFNLSLETSENVEEDLEADICLAINTPKNVKWLKVLGRVRRPRLLIYYQGRLVMDNTQSSRLLITDFYKNEKRCVPLELRNDGQVEYTLRLHSSALQLSTTDIHMASNETKTIDVEIQLSNSSRQEFTLHIELVNNKRSCQLTFVCETSYAQIVYSVRKIDERQIIPIFQSAHMEQIWDTKQSSLKPVEHEVTFTNNGRAAAIVNFDQMIAKNNSPTPPTSQFRIEPDHFLVLPQSSVPVRFIYQPFDLRAFDVDVQLKFNDSTSTIQIPFYVEFHKPVLRSLPRAVIDIGMIQTGQVFKENALTLQNVGLKELRFFVSEVADKPLFVKTATLQGSAAPSQPTSINQPIRINPNQSQSFSVKIEIGAIDAQFESEIIELAQFQLTSLCDPVIDTDNKLSNRSILIVIIAHTLPLPTFTLPGNSNLQVWSTLRPLPAMWLHETYQQHSAHSAYAPFVALTAIAHVCGSDKTTHSLPTNNEQWATLCSNLSTADRLTLDAFNDANIAQRATETLATQLRSSCTNYRSFFYHCQLFHRSFTTIDSIRLQLFAVINSAANIDQAFLMQSYVTKFWSVYEQCSPDGAYRGAIDFVHLCVGHDRAMPQEIRTFSSLMHTMIHPPAATNTAQQLSKLITSVGTLGELLSVSTALFDLKWTLLFGLLNGRVKQIIIGLVQNDYQALLDLQRAYAQLHQPGSVQQAMLEAVRSADQSWNRFDFKQKSDLLTPLLVNWTELVPIIQTISDGRPATLVDLLSITNVILSRLGVSSTFSTHLRELFERHTFTRIYDKLWNFPGVSYTARDSLANQIYRFRQPLVYYTEYQPMKTSNIESYCDIVQQLVLLTPSQWSLSRRAIETIGSLLCDLGNKTFVVSAIVTAVLRFLSLVQSNENWSSVQESYVQVSSTPTWKTTTKFVKEIDCNNELVRLAETFQEVSDMEATLETIFELARLVSTSDELTLLNTHTSSIRALQSTAASPVELLQLIEPFVLPEIKLKIHAYLVLLRLSSLDSVTSDECYILFNEVVPSWLTLFDITSPELQRLFETLSSVLTSFPGLLITRGVPLCQQLYTTSMAAALCTLAHYRQSTRSELVHSSASRQTARSPSILETVKQALAQRTAPKHHSTPAPNASIAPAVAPIVTPTATTTVVATAAIVCPYSDETLTKMELSVANYVKSNARQSVRFDESDTIQDIVNDALDYRSQVAQWYAIFATFNVLMHHRANENNPNQVTTGHTIVQRGLQLLRDIIVAKKILEPTFAYTGIRFLVNDLNQLEKCLLSLALENYPVVLNILRQLNVDITQRKQDFKPPSRSTAPASNTPKKTRLELIQEIAAAPESTERHDASEPPMSNQNDVPLTVNDWQNAMRTNNEQQFDDMLKLATKKREQSKKKTVGKSNSAVQTNVQTLAANMLAQNTKNPKVTPHTVGGSDSLSPNDGIPGIDIDLQMKAMQQHLQKQPNLVEMYEKANAKIASATPEGKLDNRAALKSTVKPSQWTYQLLIETAPIARMIDAIVQEFRSNWEKLMNNIHLSDQHQIRWCIMVDNSGSMSIHRTVIYETLVVLMELLRKLETKFAVARFGTRKNQKILKNLHDLFTNEDGQYVLEALTFDEGTYPATGLARVADQVFPVGADPHCAPNTIVHRLVLMITDGLTEERDDASYSRTIAKNKINLGFMFIETAEQSSSQLLLRGLQQVQHCVLKANNISELPLKVPQLMYDMIQARFMSIAATSADPRSASPIINIKMPRQIEQPTNEKRKYTAENPTSYTISSPTATIPRLIEVMLGEQGD